MNTVSASSYDLSSNPRKRKRGRPRKEEVSGSESNKRVLRNPNSDVGLVGQEVSGFFVGVFDAGYLLTVQVGSSGPIMNGLVFDPQLAVPITAENDVAPHLPMLTINDLSAPVEEDFFNRGAVSSKDDMVPKNPLESHAPKVVGETMRSAKTLRILLEGVASDISSHPQSQFKSDGTPISAALLGITKPSNGYDPSVSVAASLEAPKDVPADISKETPVVNVSDFSEGFGASSHVFGEALSIPKGAPTTSTKGLSFRIAPSVGFKPSEVSVISQKDSLDETSRKADFEVGLILEHKTEETRGMNLSSQKSDQPFKVRKVDSLTDFNSISEIPIAAKPHIPVAEKVEDCRTVSESF